MAFRNFHALFRIHLDFIEVTETVAHIQAHISSFTEMTWAHIIANHIYVWIWTLVVVCDILCIDDGCALLVPFCLF